MQLTLFDTTPPAAPVRVHKRIQLEIPWIAPAPPPPPAAEPAVDAPGGPTYYDRTNVRIDVGDQGPDPVRCPHLEGRTHEEHSAHAEAKHRAYGYHYPLGRDHRHPKEAVCDLGPWKERTPENMAFQDKPLNTWTHYDHFDAHCEEVRQLQEKAAAKAAGTWVEPPEPKYRKPTMDERFGHWEPARIAARYRAMEAKVLTDRQVANRKAKAAVAKANDKRVDQYLKDLVKLTEAQICRKYGKNENKHPQYSLCGAQKQLNEHTEAVKFIRWADRLPAKRRGIRKARRARK